MLRAAIRPLTQITLDLRERALPDFSLWLATVLGAPRLRWLLANVDQVNVALASGRARFRRGGPKGSWRTSSGRPVAACERGGDNSQGHGGFVRIWESTFQATAEAILWAAVAGVSAGDGSLQRALCLGSNYLP